MMRRNSNVRRGRKGLVRPFGPMIRITTGALVALTVASASPAQMWTTSPWQHGQAEVDQPYTFQPDHPLTGTTNIRYEDAGTPGWDFFNREREQFGYNPCYLPNVVTFDSENRPWMIVGDLGQDGVTRPYSTAGAYSVAAPNKDASGSTYIQASNDSYIQRMNADGQWEVLSLTSLVNQVAPSYLSGGASLVQVSDERASHERVYFDRDGDVYIQVTKGGSLGLLLHYSQQNGVWASYTAPGLGYPLEAGQQFYDEGPPTFYRTETNALKLIVPTKNPDGTLNVPNPNSPIAIDMTTNLPPGASGSWEPYMNQRHSGRSSNLVTYGDSIHLVFLSLNTDIQGPDGEGNAQVYMRVNRTTGAVETVPQILAYTYTSAAEPTIPDGHNVPSIAVDGNGYLHIITGAHHDEIHHIHSTKSVDDPTWDAAADWSPAEVIGTYRSSDPRDAGGYTYPAIQVDAGGNILVAVRNMSNYEDVGCRMTLDLLRGMPNASGDWTWEDLESLVVPDTIRYSNFYHKLTMDNDERLYLTYYYIAGTSSPSGPYDRDGLYDAHIAEWPAETYDEYYADSGQCFPHDAVTLYSDDFGGTWHLATSASFAAAVVPEPTTLTLLGGGLILAASRGRKGKSLLVRSLITLER